MVYKIVLGFGFCRSLVEVNLVTSSCVPPVQRRRPAAKVEMGTSSHNDVDMSWIPQETLNQISKSSLHHSTLYYLVATGS